jgi:ABC-2 type transport system permease protein
MTTFLRQSCSMTGRYLRSMSRQPAFVFITLAQPIIWLLLFGALFKKIVDIPGFGGGSYIDFLTPGVVIMTALFSAGWSGMGFIEDMDAGIMDRFLVAPVQRGAMIAGSLAYQAIATVIQSGVIIGLGAIAGAGFPGGAGGIATLIASAVLIAVAFAALSNGFSLVARRRESLIAAASALVLPLTFLSTAFMQKNLTAKWIQHVARFNPVDWAINAGRDAVGHNVHWRTVGSYSGFLVIAVAVCAALATRAFRAYQRSI